MPISSFGLDPTNTRQTAVRDAMRHAWKAYRTYAWGYDELLPISKKPSAWFGLGLTIVDAIDTLYIMNMTEGRRQWDRAVAPMEDRCRLEYKDAREWISSSLDCDSDSVDKFNSHFEVTIRVLGGLLSVYHLSADEIFLKRAVRSWTWHLHWCLSTLQIELGDRLLLNFNTPTGLPMAEINIKRKAASGYRYELDYLNGGDSFTSRTVVDGRRIRPHQKLALFNLKCVIYHVSPVIRNTRCLSIGTRIQTVYFLSLQDAADKSATVLHNQSKKDGLVPIFISPLTGRFSGGVVSFGARGDSYYEYLLKQWLQTGKTRSV